MRLLKSTAEYKIFDAGAAKVVVFNDDRKQLVYRKAEAKDPQFAEYERDCLPGEQNPV